MSVEALAMALHHSRAKGTDKLILLGLANHDGDAGAWVSIETLARYANTHERTVQRSIAKLVSYGDIQVTIQGGGPLGMHDARRPNLYRVMVRCPEWCDRSTRHKDTRRKAGAQLELLEAQLARVAPTPPGGAHATGGGGAHATGGGGAHATLTVLGNHPKNHVVAVASSVQDARERCQLCGRTPAGCAVVNALVPVPERHTYEPRTLL